MKTYRHAVEIKAECRECGATFVRANGPVPRATRCPRCLGPRTAKPLIRVDWLNAQGVWVRHLPGRPEPLNHAAYEAARKEA